MRVPPVPVLTTGEPTALVPVRAADDAARVQGARWWPCASALLLAVCLVAGTAVYLVKAKVLVPTRRVPALLGASVGSAQSKLRAEHFVVRVDRGVTSVAVASGRVVRERPRQGTLVKQGSTVHLVPSTGLPTVRVPSLAGPIDCTIASDLLLAAHLKASCPAGSVYTNSVPAGDVVSWSVGGRLEPATALYGSTVAVTVSKGKPPVHVPALAGASWLQAEATLAADGLKPHQIREYSTTTTAGVVISTTPPGGATVAAGAPIGVIVSKGPLYVLVPTVAGDTLSKAIAAFEAAGLKGGPVHGPVTGKVYKTKPKSGQKVKIGTHVTMYTKAPR